MDNKKHPLLGVVLFGGSGGTRGKPLRTIPAKGLRISKVFLFARQASLLIVLKTIPRIVL